MVWPPEKNDDFKKKMLLRLFLLYSKSVCFPLNHITACIWGWAERSLSGTLLCGAMLQLGKVVLSLARDQ